MQQRLRVVAVAVAVSLTSGVAAAQTSWWRRSVATRKSR